MKRFLKFIVAISLTASTLFAASSEASFPADWKSFSKMNTPLASIGALPGCDADVSSLPAIYQETVAMYCAVKPGGPGAVAILANDVASFKARSGTYKDGTFYILHLKDLKVLFVTEWKGNKPLYGIWTEDGQDAANVVGSGLNPADCRACHTGYA
ncbi:MAG: hypothetical protein KAJ49_03230, partial [Arcobacteraceae bacterium]|nr:hypothetical protein [Arcobacteraceae bacterium]